MISVFNRLGTGQLCQGYIRLLTSLLDQLDLTVFSLPSLLLSLLRRLLLLAGPQAAPQQTSRWLSAWPDRPQDLASLDTPRLVLYALTVATRAVLPKLSTLQLSGLLGSLLALLQQEQEPSCVSLAAVSLTRLSLLLRPASLPQSLLLSITTRARKRCFGALLGPLVSCLQGGLVSRNPELREQLAPGKNSFRGSGLEVVWREGGLREDSLALRVNSAWESSTPVGILLLRKRTTP